MSDPIICELVVGSETFPLAMISDKHGHSPIMQGVTEVQWRPHQYEQPLSLDEMLFTERWQIVVKDGDGPDGIARRTRRLMNVLRQAWAYHQEDYYTSPVYLRARSACESNVRTALVYQSTDITAPWPMWDPALEQAGILDLYAVSIARFVWRDGTPGTIPSATALETPQGDTGQTLVNIGNYQDDHLLTHVFNNDNSAGTFSANLYGTAAHDYFLVVNPIAVDDHVYFGADEPFSTLAGYILTAGNFVWTITAEYWNGGWVALTLGTEYTMLPSTIANSLSRTGPWQFNWVPKSDWVATAINGQNKLWLRWTISVFTSTAVVPANGTYAIFNVHQSYLDIPETAVKGDGPPYALLRLRKPYGTPASAPDIGTTSRVIVGSKSRGLDGFTAFLNAGGDGMPAAWTAAVGTDAAQAADVSSPGGDHLHVTFATTATMANRVRFTGAGVLPYYVGKYRVFIRCLQDGAGSAGDMNLKVRFRINGTADTDPVWETATVATTSDDYMVLDMTPGGFIKLPFGDVVDADDLTNADLIIEIHAELTNGTDHLTIYDLILMPCDEWIADLDDPLTDTTTGASALRGYSMLDVDSGIVADRTIKQVLDYPASLTAPPIYFAETWNRRGAPMRLPVGRESRLFFLAERYLTNYTDGELWGLTGEGLAVEVFLQPIYYYLRGDD